MKRQIPCSAMFGLAILTPSTAWAHVGLHHAPTLFEGLIHPLTGWDHVALLAASGVAMAVSLDQGKLPGRWEILGLFGLFSSGVAVMLGAQLLSGLCVAVSLAALLATAGGAVSKRQIAARVGVAGAVALQTASHYLASGDLVPNLEFAMGFAASSIAIFVASYATSCAALRKHFALLAAR